MNPWISVPTSDASTSIPGPTSRPCAVFLMASGVPNRLDLTSRSLIGSYFERIHGDLDHTRLTLRSKAVQRPFELRFPRLQQQCVQKSSEAPDFVPRVSNCSVDSDPGLGDLFRVWVVVAQQRRIVVFQPTLPPHARACKCRTGRHRDGLLRRDARRPGSRTRLPRSALRPFNNRAVRYCIAVAVSRDEPRTSLSNSETRAANHYKLGIRDSKWQLRAGMTRFPQCVVNLEGEAQFLIPLILPVWREVKLDIHQQRSRARA